MAGGDILPTQLAGSLKATQPCSVALLRLQLSKTVNVNPMTRARPRDAVRNLYQLRCPAATQNVAADQLLLQLGNGLCNSTFEPCPKARLQLGLVARCKAGSGSLADPLPASLCAGASGQSAMIPTPTICQCLRLAGLSC